MANWEKFDISPELKSSAEGASKIKNTIEAISSVVDTVSSILDILKSFLNAKSDPRAAAVKTLLNQIQQTLENLQKTGVYSLFLNPESLEDLAENYQGGYQEFEDLFLHSLLDVQDSERPKIGSSGSLGGLFLFIGSGTSGNLLRKAQTVRRLFNTPTIDYPPPVNVRALPANENGVPLERSFIDAFTGDDEPESLLLEWEEPRTANDVFLDVFAASKFYIERAKDLQGDPIQKKEVPTEKQNPIEKEKEKNGEVRLEKGKKDKEGRDLEVWEPLDEDDPFVEPNETDPGVRKNFLSGTYSYHLEDIGKGIENGYYYRIRSVPTDVTLEKENDGNHVLKRNGVPYTGSSFSSPVFGAIPDADFSFNLPSAILNVFRVAYIFRMDVRVFDRSGSALPGNNLVDRTFPFESLNLEEGVQTYSANGVDTKFFSGALFGNPQDILGFEESRKKVKEDLVVDPFKFDAFGGVDEFLSPATDLSPNERMRLAIDRMIEEDVERLTKYISQNDTLFQVFQDRYNSVEGDIEDFLSSKTSLAEFLDEDGLRGDIASTVSLLEKNVRPGTPPNWEKIEFTKDLFPQVDELFDKLFKTISAADKSLQNVLDDITASIEGVQDRLEKLTAIISKIEELIEVLDQLKAAFGLEIDMLWIPPQSGGVSQFVENFQSAGNKPSSDDDDFFSGIVLAVGGQGDIEAQAQTLKFIFGV